MKKIILSFLCAFMVFASMTPVHAATAKESLDALLQEVATLDEEKYSYESYCALEDEVKEAKALTLEASEEDINQAIADINEAVNNLVDLYANLALNKEITASSTYPNAKFDVNNAVDGDTSTRWGNHYNSSAYKGGNHEETLTVNLGSKYHINAVSIHWESAHATEFTIQGSVDGTTFFNIKDVTDAPGKQEYYGGLGNVEVQYIRLALHEASGKYGYSIYELGVHEHDKEASVYNNIALNKDVDVSSTYVGIPVAAKDINDGSLATRWGSDYTTGNKEEYVGIDLGSTYKVDRVVLTFEAAYATQFKLQASTDGSTYNDITDVLAGNLGEVRVVDLNTETRYIRVLLLEGATEYGYSIYEVEVYGERETDLLALVEELEDRLANVEVGNKDGNIAQEDYDAYVAVVKEAKALLETEARNADLLAMIKTLNGVLETFDDHLIKGEATASIYPTPQYMSVDSTNGMKLKGTVDLIVHGAQDEATLPKVEELLTSEGIAYQYASSLGNNPAIILAVNDECELCNSVNDQANALDQKQGYVLKTSNDSHTQGLVTIIGSDQDGVYYGVMSLLQLFKQQTSDGRIAEVTISDYPDVEFRGYVEGFYGIPWTFNDRKELFEDTSLYKMTTYIYAPKDDPYHRKSWRTLYPEAEAQNIQALAEVAAANNMEFCWTIHPGADYDYTTDSDQDGVVDDYETIIAKFEQVYSLGVRQFGVFYDDLSYSVADGIQHSTVINDAYAYLTSKYDDVKPFITVVTRYTNSWGADWNTYFTPFMKNIHEDTIVLWTGQSTMSAITKAYMEYPQTKTGVDRDLGVWWNFPVTDYYYGHLLMGSLDCLSNDVDNIVSFFLNPMSEADASKVAIYSGADYSWNTEAFNSTESWKRAIKELVGEYNEEFERFADNLAYVDKGNGFFFDESKYLKSYFEDFNNALSKGLTKEDISVVKGKFEEMLSDAQALRNIKSAALYEEIKEHLNAYEALANAGISTMNAFEAALDGNVNETIENMSLYKEYLEECGTYKIKKLSGTAVVSTGDYRIKPFLKQLQDHIMSLLNEHLDSGVDERMITNVLDIEYKDIQATTKSYSLTDVNAVMNKGDYVGIALPKVMNIYEITAEVTPADQFLLQYSLNGIDWTYVPFTKENNVLTTNDIITGAYVRLLCVADNVDATVVNLTVDEAYECVVPSISTNMPTYQTYNIGQALDGSLSTNFWSSTGSSDGHYICVDLGDIASINTVELYSGINKYGVVDGYDKTQLEVSNDGLVWSKVGSPKALSEYEDVDDTMKKLVFDNLDATGRYFRFVAVGSSDSWAKVYEVVYDADYVDYENRINVDTNMIIYQNYTADKAMDHDYNTFAWVYSDNFYAENGGNGSMKGDYFQVDLGTLVPLYDASIYFGKNTKQPQYITDGFKSVKLQTSVDGETWKDVGDTVAMETYVSYGNTYKATMSANGELVRYIRFVADEAYTSWAKVYEVTYNDSLNSITTSGTVSTNMTHYQNYVIGNAMDKDLSSKFYSNKAIAVGNYVQVDFGSVISLFDASIYFGGDPNNSQSFDGFKKMDLQVSNDGSTWTTVKSLDSSTYRVVGGKYLASTELSGVTGRYLRFSATEASSSWLQVYEVQFNNTLDANAVRFVDGVGTVNINNSHYLDDARLETSAYIYEVNTNDTLIYPTNTITHVTTLGILQDATAISKATVSVQDLDGNWTNIGTLADTWNVFEVNEKILAIKLTFDGTMQPVIYEILIDGLADYSRVDRAIELVPEDLSIYTDESVQVLNDALNAVVRDLNISQQETVEGYVKPIIDALKALELKEADYELVNVMVEEYKYMLQYKDLYTEESWQAYEDAYNAVVYGLDITHQEEVNAMASAIYVACENLELLADYTVVDEAIAKVPADLSVYSEESVQALNDAINAVVRGLGESKQEEVNAMAKAIEDAIASLQYNLVDKTELIELVLLVKADVTDESIYTPSTYAPFIEALLKAESVIADQTLIANRDEVIVEEAWTNLAEAWSNLRIKADKELLKELLAKAEAIDLEAITEESSEALSLAITKAVEVLENEEATQEEVEEAVKVLSAALEVEYKETDKTETGDSTPYELYIGLGVVCLVGVFFLLKKKKDN